MDNNTDRINSILHNELYNEYLKKIELYEANRIYCRHNLQHFLDVARIGYIITLEKKLNIKKDIIYAAALLHDIGRWKQYENGTPHNIASAEQSLEILKAAGYNDNEIDEITKAIEGHRGLNCSENKLENIISVSDKKSRSCFYCAARESCNWTEEKRNYDIEY
ncbi:HD domain-containing protein [Clostridium omnivorum]|uniref:HD domain-containing protein n=1 Tax=Clostridium omnivorum TaxID=1604902 RepID=A0ABQ5NA70_9CLOT|nr:HD domain-containing protein [Clostridium sp. E14]GLC31989.1 HD domain-containing protein [Clostridium sp. E14]